VRLVRLRTQANKDQEELSHAGCLRHEFARIRAHSGESLVAVKEL